MKINISNERIIISSPEDVLLDIPNTVAVDVAFERIIAIGLTSKDIEEFHKENKNPKIQIGFLNPFSAIDFQPKIAAEVINKSVFHSIHPVEDSRLSFWKRIFFKTKTNWDINIVEYNLIDPKHKESFEYYAQKTGLVKVNELSINGNSVEIENIRLAEFSLAYGVSTISISIFSLISFATIQFLSSNLQAQIITSNFIFTIIFVSLYIWLFLSFPYFVCRIIWKIIATKFISNSMARIIMNETKMHFSKPIMNFLWNMSFPTKDGG